MSTEKAKKVQDRSFATLEKALGLADEITENLPIPVDDGSDEEPIEFNAEVKFEEGSGKEITTQDVLDDFMFVRETMHHIIMEGQKALAAVMNAGAVTAHPRAFEVASTIMSNITVSAKSLLELQEKMYDLQEKNKELQNKNSPVENGTTTGEPQAVMHGTTAEIIKAVRESEKNESKNP